MSDHEEIRTLSYAYTFALDAGDFAEVAAILADAALRMRARGMAETAIHGAEAIERFYASQVVLYDGDPRTRHLIANHAVTVTGDSATSRCYFTVMQKPPGRPYGICLGGQYHDRFARGPGGWRFEEKIIQVDVINDIAHHFRIAPDRASD